MNDKDTIKQLQVQVDFLKRKLRERVPFCDGNITVDPVVNRIIKKTC